MVSEFFAQHDLTFDQVKVLTHAMMAVARVDGVHDNEMRLVREFYDSCTRAGDPSAGRRGRRPVRSRRGQGPFRYPRTRQDVREEPRFCWPLPMGEYAKLEDDLIRQYAEVVGRVRRPGHRAA